MPHGGDAMQPSHGHYGGAVAMPGYPQPAYAGMPTYGEPVMGQPAYGYPTYTAYNPSAAAAAPAMGPSSGIGMPPPGYPAGGAPANAPVGAGERPPGYPGAASVGMAVPPAGAAPLHMTIKRFYSSWGWGRVSGAEMQLQQSFEGVGYENCVQEEQCLPQTGGNDGISPPSIQELSV